MTLTPTAWPPKRARPRIARSRSIGLFAAFAALLLVFWVLHVLLEQARWGDEARLASFLRFKPTGERLTIEQLHAHERVVIHSVMNGHGRSEARTFTFSGGESIQLEIADRALGIDPERNLLVGETLSATEHVLTKAQAAGVDALLRTLRNPQEPTSRYYETYEVEHIRDGLTIGREKFVDFRHIIWRRGDAYEHLPPDLQALTTPEDWPKLIDLRELTRTLRLNVEL